MTGPFTRRSFFITAGGAVGAMAVPAIAARAAASEPYRIAIETYCFHDVDLATTLAHTKALGVRFLELHDGHLPYAASHADLERAQAALHQAGITASGVYIHDAFTDSEAVARPIFEYAKTMRFGYVNGGPKREALPLLNRLSPEYGIQIAVHNHGPGMRYETLEHITSVLDEYPNIVACVDIGHFARSHVDPVRAIRTIGRRMVAVHITDVNAAGDNTVLGEGTIDVPGVFATLAEIRFSGLAVLEYEGDIDNMTARLAGMRKSLAVMHRLIAANARK
jgi:inosose dehydratase